SERARREAARGDAASDPAAHARESDDGADLAERRHERRGAQGGGIGDRPDPRLHLLRAVRRREAQGPVTLARWCAFRSTSRLIWVVRSKAPSISPQLAI